MMKKLILVMLMMGTMLTNAQAKEPTLQETVDFINRVFSSDEASSSVKHGRLFFYKKPSFRVDGDCKVTISQFKDDESHGIKFENTYYVDLKKHKFEYSEYSKKNNHIWIRDRREADTIKSVNRMFGKRSSPAATRIDNSELLRVKINGKYQEKMEKALNHLSTMCVGKLGDDDPF